MLGFSRAVATDQLVGTMHPSLSDMSRLPCERVVLLGFDQRSESLGSKETEWCGGGHPILRALTLASGETRQDHLQKRFRRTRQGGRSDV